MSMNSDIAIACLINQFELEHFIYRLEGDKMELIQVVDTDDVGHTIATYSNNNNIENVVLSGGSREFLERFADDIYTVNALAYHDNPIKVFFTNDEDEGEE